MFVGLAPQKHDFSINASRRKELVSFIKELHPNIKNGLVVLFAGFEEDRQKFRQESSFYYMTGVTEPGVVLTIDLEGKSTLWVPNCQEARSQWMSRAIHFLPEDAKTLHVDEIALLGSKCPGYQFYPFFLPKEYENFLTLLEDTIKKKGTIFTLQPSTAYQYVEQRLVLARLKELIPGLASQIVDISPLIAAMRRSKDMREIEHIYRAIEITIMAQEAAAQAIKPNISECEVQASLEYIFTASCARNAFPSIVAAGKNGTVLHYTDNAKLLESGELVVVDIGAESNYYCADLTRTYPVSGTFTKRQRELYDLVLETQEYIASSAKPGLWLSNKERPEESLNHLAKKFLQERGYGNYFVHGIGHFLGLDVHDVGNYKEPLKSGDVFTIEPGIYIPEEGIGIRIEDDYWMVKDSVMCLSEQLPKDPKEIEKMVQQTF